MNSELGTSQAAESLQTRLAQTISQGSVCPASACRPCTSFLPGTSTGFASLSSCDMGICQLSNVIISMTIQIMLGRMTWAGIWWRSGHGTFDVSVPFPLLEVVGHGLHELGLLPDARSESDALAVVAILVGF